MLPCHSLPTKTTKIFLDVRKEWNRKIEDDLFIDTGCSIEHEKNGIAVADRLWIVGRKLMDEGYIKRMTCLRNVDEKAEFHFYFPVCDSHLYYESVVELCDTFYHKAHYYGFMYFKMRDGKKYRYSAEGELYEDEKFVFLKK